MENLNKLRGARQARKLSQQQMADLLGIDRTTYGKKENGDYEFWESEIDLILMELNEKYENIFLRHNLTKRKKPLF